MNPDNVVLKEMQVNGCFEVLEFLGKTVGESGKSTALHPHGQILSPDEELVVTKYFTTRISFPHDRKVRQSKFIDALETLPDLKIFYGRYQNDSKTCDRCNAIIYFQNEKQTDVNIASEMLVDAFQERFDTAILVSGDSDLCAPITHIRSLPSPKRVLVAFPPKRYSYELNTVASAIHQTVKKEFRDNQFPESVTSKSGFTLTKPPEWG